MNSARINLFICCIFGHFSLNKRYFYHFFFYSKDLLCRSCINKVYFMPLCRAQLIHQVFMPSCTAQIHQVFVQALSLFRFCTPLDIITPSTNSIISMQIPLSSPGLIPLPPPTKLQPSQYYCVSDCQLRLNIVYIIYLLCFQLNFASSFPYNLRYHHHRLYIIFDSHLS